MKYFLFIFLVISQVSCGTLNSPSYIGSPSYNRLNRSRGITQQRQAGMPPGPGCYSRCMIPDQYESHSTPIIEYTGDKYNDPNVEPKRIIVKEASSKWVKKKTDKNCLSNNPDDCLVWCLVENKGEFYDYYTVVDTTLNKEFINKEIEYEVLISRGGYTEWKQVVCDVQISKKLYRDVYSALIERGYSIGGNINHIEGFMPETKAALIKFQKDNNLPMGQLDLETLALLGVEH